jgi:PmbA protein
LSEELLNILDYCIKKSTKLGADIADAIIYDSKELSVSQRLGKIESVESSHSKAIGLRAMVKSSKGYSQAVVSSTDLDIESLDGSIKRCIDMARESSEDQYACLASRELTDYNVEDLELKDDTEVDKEELIDWASRAEEVALSIDGVNNSEGADASYTKSSVAIASSDGFVKAYDSTLFSNSVSVVAGKGDKKESDYDYTLSRHVRGLISPEIIGENAGKQTVKKLNPRKVKTCQAPVIYAPRQSKNLMASLASAINGSSVSKGITFLSNKMGDDIFRDGINIYDNPSMKGMISSYPFDGEGVIGKETAIVANGKLSSWLLDAYTANKLGLKTTGHAKRGVSSIPYPGSSNFYMEGGVSSPEELISDIKQGLYVTDTFGMGINETTGDYSQGAAGFWIENGVIAYPVSEITIAGNLLDMFKSLIPANDLEFRYSINCPSVRIEGMTIAGD